MENVRKKITKIQFKGLRKGEFEESTNKIVSTYGFPYENIFISVFSEIKLYFYTVA